MHEFGRLVLNKNPENFHRDVEQAAFSPGSLVPGIEDSPDPLLQFRMFFYRDAQYHRIGVNLHQVPGMFDGIGSRSLFPIIDNPFFSSMPLYTNLAKSTVHSWRAHMRP